MDARRAKRNREPGAGVGIPMSSVDRTATEPPTRRFARRAITLPAVHLLGLLVLASLPAVVPLLALRDAAGRGPPWARARFALFLAWYLVHELWGIWAACALWARGRGADVPAHFALQHAWEAALVQGLGRIYGLRFSSDADSASVPSAARALVLVRHASVADSLLPGLAFGPSSPLAFDGPRRSLDLRWVLKRELLAVPCLDLVGHRIPTVFVRRGGRDTRTDAEAVARLAVGLGPGEGVLIFPEGTRYTQAKHAALVAAGRTPYRHVLPPRPAGALAMLAAADDAPTDAPPAELVVLAHRGLEGVHRFADLWRGALVDREVRLTLWRTPLAALPSAPDARRAWLEATWARMDAWLDAAPVERSADGS